MSVQLKNAGKVKGFFLKHGEKLGILVVALVAAWLMYSSLGQEVEDRQPQELGRLVNETSTKIDSFDFAKAKELADPPPLMAESFIATPAEKIDPAPFEVNQFDRPVVPPIVLRKDPVLLAAQDLEGHGYTVLMPFYNSAIEKQRALEMAAEERRRERERELEQRRNQEEDPRRRGRRDPEETMLGPDGDPNKRPVNSSYRDTGGAALTGTEQIKIESCAVVLAKVPAVDQLKIYTDAFENALGHEPSRDIPQYLGFFVERAEVRGDKRGDWEPAKLRNGSNPSSPLIAVTDQTIPAAMADWVGEAEELLDGSHFHPVLTFPLPALVGKNWGPEVVHSDLPLASETAALQEEMMEQEEVVDPTAQGGSIFGNADPRGRGGMEMMEPGMGRSPRGLGGRLGGRRPPRGMGGRGGMMMEPGMGSMGMPGGGRGGSRGMGGSRGGEFTFAAPFAMVRFLDFDVEPGRRYQYRFQLVLADVNATTNTKFLEKEVKQRVDALARSSVHIVRSEWSEPSPPISIPLAGNIYVAEAERTGGETTVTLLVESFDIGPDGKAMQATLEQEKVRPGSVMNFVEDAEILVDEGRYLKKVEDFRFRTGITVLDAEGGRKLTRDMNSPASVLVMDATGRLTVRSQLEDESEVVKRRDLYSEGDGTGVGAPSRSMEMFDMPF